jgi:hypothetical protein
VAELDQSSSIHSDIYHGSQISQKHSSSKEEALILIEAKLEQRILNKQSNAVALDEKLDHNENKEWLWGCEWPSWLTNKLTNIIVAVALPPSADTREDF